MSTAHISIMMATRNVVDALPAALESVRQHAPESPLYIWDGESTDGTREDLTHTAISHWESGADKGIYDALGKTLDWVKTPFVYIMGADDRLREGWTELATFASDTSTAYYGDVWFISAEQRYNGRFEGLDLARTNISQQAVIYPTEVLRKHPFHDAYSLQADWDLHMWIHAQPHLNFHYVSICVCDFNDRTGASSNRYDEAFNRDYPKLLKRYFGWKAWLKYGMVAYLAHHSRKWRGKS